MPVMTQAASPPLQDPSWVHAQQVHPVQVLEHPTIFVQGIVNKSEAPTDHV